jgi:hypothetical protein
MHDHIDAPTVVAPRDLAVSNRVVVVEFPAHDGCESFSASLAQVEPQVVRECTLAVGAFCGTQKIVDDHKIVSVHIPQYLEA